MGMIIAKQYITNSRMRNKVHLLIKTNEEWISVESRYNTHPIQIKKYN